MYYVISNRLTLYLYTPRVWKRCEYSYRPPSKKFSPEYVRVLGCRNIERSRSSPTAPTPTMKTAMRAQQNPPTVVSRCCTPLPPPPACAHVEGSPHSFSNLLEGSGEKCLKLLKQMCTVTWVGDYA